MFLKLKLIIMTQGLDDSYWAIKLDDSYYRIMF